MFHDWGPWRIGSRPMTEADMRAEALLKRYLSPAQWRSWQEADFIRVDSRLDPNISYRVRPRANVVAANRRTGRLCAICIVLDEAGFPEADSLLALYALCRWDEPRLWTVGKHAKHRTPRKIMLHIMGRRLKRLVRTLVGC